MTVAIVLLVMMSAYFSATETAFSCLNKIRMKSRAESGDHRAALAMDLVEDYDRLIAAARALEKIHADAPFFCQNRVSAREHTRCRVPLHNTCFFVPRQPKHANFCRIPPRGLAFSPKSSYNRLNNKRFMEGLAMNTIFIGIAGGTGSGKTTLTEHLKQHFGDDISVVHHDSYYKYQDRPFEERCKQNYDHPDAFETDLMVEQLKELKAGNAEFKQAAEQTLEALQGYGLPELDYFLEHFLPAFGLTLDELQ